MPASAEPRTPPGPTAGAHLQVRQLGVRIGGTRILHDMSFRLLPGELCGLVGPSGAGKSTLIKALLGLRAPTSGAISLGGQPPGSGGEPVGYVPQDDALHRSLTVGRALTFAARLRLHRASAEDRQARVEEVAAEVGLADRLSQRIRSLSGGQRKRVSVAMELLTRPRLLILDEPTSGLDPGLEARMMALFAEVATGGRMVLVATHAMRSLAKCRALAILMEGHLIWFGPPADAPPWFRAPDLPGIFDRLPLRTAAAWERAWLESEVRMRFDRRSPPAPPTPEPDTARPPPEKDPGPDGAPGEPDLSPEARLAALKASIRGGEGS